MMRHLIVPNRRVEETLALLRNRGWIAPGMRVFPHEDGNHRLVPLDIGAPVELPEPIDRMEESMLEGSVDERIDSDWWTHLSELVGQEEIEKHQESWPSSHEFISDMMVVRIEDILENHSSSIAEAKLRSHPHVRLILRDQGVQGEFRIRKLYPIGARIDNQIVTGAIPDSLSSTKVVVRESGMRIACDPNKAYFSTKLQSERLETLSLAKRLRETLGRPISVCDPFCGVGPALATLLSENDLVSEVLASDLNPHAIELLLENLSNWEKRQYPLDPSPIEKIFDDRIVGVANATELTQNPDFRGRWDLILVNLPHRTLELLPSLVPLLNRSSPSIIRGRVVVAENEIKDANRIIREALPPILEGSEPPSLRIKRDYSSSLRLCSFESWISGE